MWVSVDSTPVTLRIKLCFQFFVPLDESRGNKARFCVISVNWKLNVFFCHTKQNHETNPTDIAVQFASCCQMPQVQASSS